MTPIFLDISSHSHTRNREINNSCTLYTMTWNVEDVIHSCDFVYSDEEKRNDVAFVDVSSAKAAIDVLFASVAPHARALRTVTESCVSEQKHILACMIDDMNRLVVVEDAQSVFLDYFDISHIHLKQLRSVFDGRWADTYAWKQPDVWASFSSGLARVNQNVLFWQELAYQKEIGVKW